jgi:hypothetical protein
MSNINRRSVIASATVFAALGPLPLAAAEADAEVVRLFAVYREAEERDMATWAEWDEARGKAVTAARAKLGITDKEGAARARAMPIEEWEAAIAEQVEVLGFAPLQAASEAAQNARYEAWDALADAPAKSVTGIALKLVALFQWDDDLQDDWNGKGSTLGTIMCLAARADALRLAGLPHTFGADKPEAV